jgi:hypothetical protein
VVVLNRLLRPSWVPSGARVRRGAQKRPLIGVWPSAIGTGKLEEVEEHAPAFTRDVKKDLSPTFTHFALKSARSIAFSDTQLAPAFQEGSKRS